MKRNTRGKITAGVGIVVCAVVAYLLWIPPNSMARSSVRSILLSDATATEQLEDLEQYVRVGEYIDSVRQRLVPQPDEEVDDNGRGKEWALGLREVNLVLAVRADGKVIRIGRHIHKKDDGTVWLSPGQPLKGQLNPIKFN